jgi:hypothetical protein
MSPSAAVFWRIVGAIVWLAAQKSLAAPAEIQNEWSPTLKSHAFSPRAAKMGAKRAIDAQGFFRKVSKSRAPRPPLRLWPINIEIYDAMRSERDITQPPN